MSTIQDSMRTEASGSIAPEFRPLAHPHLVCRAHSPEGQYGVHYLGGEDYWMYGLWTIQTASRVVVAKNRLFRVEEMECAAMRIPLPEVYTRGSLSFS